MSSITRWLWALPFAAAGAALAVVPASAGTLDRFKQDKTFRIAFREDAPPFSFSDSVGVPALAIDPGSVRASPRALSPLAGAPRSSVALLIGVAVAFLLLGVGLALLFGRFVLR